MPKENAGRALADIQKMYGSFEPPEISDEMTVITGHAPVFNMRDYQAEVTAYTKGRGRLAASLGGYEPCHNAEEVIAAADYVLREIWTTRQARYFASRCRLCCAVAAGDILHAP